MRKEFRPEMFLTPRGQAAKILRKRPGPSEREFLISGNFALLVHTTDHELTLLTKNLNVRFENPTQRASITLGYADPPVTHDGHALIPSLCDFSPVTLRPTEEAFIAKELSGMESLKRMTRETELTVECTISPEWGRRFSVWHGSVKTRPFTVSIRPQK